METINLDQMCRICLNTFAEFDKEYFCSEEPLEKYDDTTYSEAFFSCTGCNIQPNEPQKICMPCATDLMLAFDLKVKCQQTQEVLNKLLNEAMAHTVEVLKDEPIDDLTENDEFVEVTYEEVEYNTADYNAVYQVQEDEVLEETKNFYIPEKSRSNRVKDENSMVIEQVLSVMCCYCPAEYPTNTALLFHCELKHPEQKINECYYCSKIFFHPFYEVHIKKCSQHTTRPKKDPNQKQLCPICAEMRSSNHIRWCLERQRHFDADGNIDTHPYICDICGTRKTAKSYILQHIRNEHLKKLLKCRYCPAEFKHPSTLYSHERRDHTDKVPLLKCKYCDFQSATHSSLRVHTYSKHTNVKKHKCEICNAAFVTKWKLQEHSACHSNETPFLCEVCHGKFKSREGLRRHQTKVHGLYKVKRQQI
uniref:CSON001761 protein n=1 Tax=Culicoides sonorensis TaxID=179676 RepID=A0A336M3I9_CULSO